MATASRPADAPGPPDRQAPDRQRDAERTRAEIIDVAIAEFARNGYSGARVDEIAAKTSTTKRMIYYYFGGKEQLYIAALEQRYATAREAERVDVEHLDPVSAIRPWRSSPSTTTSRTPTSSASWPSRTSTAASTSPSPQRSAS